MNEEKKRDISEMFDILKDLSPEDLALIKGGAMVLRAKQSMDSKNQPYGAPATANDCAS